MVDFVGREIRRIGLSRAVVGLSGGIDSAVSVYLAALALGPENVLAVRMPYRTSSAGSLSDAQAVIDDLGVRAETVEITDMVEPLFERVEHWHREPGRASAPGQHHGPAAHDRAV